MQMKRSPQSDFVEKSNHGSFFSRARESSCLCFNLSISLALKRNRNAQTVPHPLHIGNKLVEGGSHMNFKMFSVLTLFQVDSTLMSSAYPLLLFASLTIGYTDVYLHVCRFQQCWKTNLQIARTISSWQFKIKLNSWAVFQMISKVPILTRKNLCRIYITLLYLFQWAFDCQEYCLWPSWQSN